MDRLPRKSLYRIFRYIDQPLDLFRISCVCKRWRSLLMNNECFLNQWFAQSLKRSQQSHFMSYYCYNNNCGQLPKLNIDLLFPINLRSTACKFLPWTDSQYSCDYKALFEHCYPLSLFESSYSFSFWLFLPHRCEMNIQIGNFNVGGVAIVLDADAVYHFDKKEDVSIAHRWIHVALLKSDSRRFWQVWIDGQYVSKFNQYYLYFSKNEKDRCFINMVLRRKVGTYSLEACNQPRIANLNAFKRCLTHVEIRAIYQQQTTVSQVKVGTYIKSNKIFN